MALLACFLVVAAGCGGDGDPATDAGGTVTIEATGATRTEPAVPRPQGSPPKQLVVKDTIMGRGAPVMPGDTLTVEYVGDFYTGTQFTNSWERDDPFVFELGAGENLVDPSWETGLVGMRLGGRRELIVPPDARGAPPGTPPSETLIYVIDLVAVER